MTLIRKKVIILDFDGVIVESVDIKNEAFARAFTDYPQHYDAIMAYHFAHNTVDRYTKFRHITEEILGLEYTPEFSEKIICEFAKFTRREIIACPYVPGAHDFLEFFYGRVPIYLASATPLAELEHITAARDLAKFFAAQYGAPEEKPAMFARIGEVEHVTTAEMVFVGDSHGDMHAADQAGIDFVARMNKDRFPADAFPVFQDLKEIREYLASLVLPR